jgi:hypothetical protein
VSKVPRRPCLFPPEFYEKRCRTVCTRWQDAVSARNIIKAFECATLTVTASHLGFDIAWVQENYGVDFNAVFRTNRLLLAELLTAIERSRRNPTTTSMIIEISTRMRASYFHDERGLLYGPLHCKEVASFIEKNFGKDVTEAAVKTALMRYRKITHSVDRKWTKIIQDQGKPGSRFSDATQSKKNADDSAYYADPQRTLKKSRARKKPSGRVAKNVQPPDYLGKIRALNVEGAKRHDWFMNKINAVTEFQAKPAPQLAKPKPRKPLSRR